MVEMVRHPPGQPPATADAICIIAMIDRTVVSQIIICDLRHDSSYTINHGCWPNKKLANNLPGLSYRGSTYDEDDNDDAFARTYMTRTVQLRYTDTMLFKS